MESLDLNFNKWSDNTSIQIKMSMVDFHWCPLKAMPYSF